MKDVGSSAAFSRTRTRTHRPIDPLNQPTDPTHRPNSPTQLTDPTSSFHMYYDCFVSDDADNGNLARS